MKLTRKEFVELAEKSVSGICIPIKTEEMYNFNWIRIPTDVFLKSLEPYSFKYIFCEQDFPEKNSTIYIHTVEYPINESSH